MSHDERESLEIMLDQSPMDWELRLAVIRAYVVRDDMDGAKRFVRESPEEAGPAPAHVQHRLHRLMTEGRPAAEEFARVDGGGFVVETGGVQHSAQGFHPAKQSDRAGELGVAAAENDPVMEPAADLPVSEYAMRAADFSTKRRALEDSRFVLVAVGDIVPSPSAESAGRKVSALAFSLLVHVGLVLLLGFVVIAIQRPNPPQIVAVNAEENQVIDVPPKRFEKIKRPKRPAASAQATVIVSSSVSSPVFVPEFDLAGEGTLPAAMVGFGTGFGASGAGSGLGEEGGGGSIGGMRIESQRLGVILDVSGSMDEQIRAVRREIRKNFLSATVVEVVGCSLEWGDGDPGFDLRKARGRVRMKRNADSVVEAVEILVAAGKVDAIFWFSDLQDSQSEAGLKRLSHLLGTYFGSERRPVKFYVQSVGREPSSTLAGIAKRSGGATKVESFE